MAATEEETKRINVSLPRKLAEDLERLVPRGERNRFIVEAIAKAVRRNRLLHALEVSFGAWSDEDHPDLLTDEDIDRYVRRMRESWMPRSWDEIAGEVESSEPVPAGQ